MSWSVTLDNIDQMLDLPESVRARLSEDNPQYESDAVLAFECAKQAGLVSGMLSGGRTPNPYAGANVVMITITGLDSRETGHAVPRGFMDDMTHIVTQPEVPDWDYETDKHDGT